MADGIPDAQADINISIINLSGSLVAALSLPSAFTIRNLKIRLARACSSPPFAQQLLWGHRILLDHEILGQLGFPSDTCTFQLLCRPCLTQAGGELLECA